MTCFVTGQGRENHVLVNPGGYCYYCNFILWMTECKRLGTSQATDCLACDTVLHGQTRPQTCDIIQFQQKSIPKMKLLCVILTLSPFITVSGWITFPSDLDIFFPSSSTTNPWTRRDLQKYSNNVMTCHPFSGFVKLT